MRPTWQTMAFGVGVFAVSTAAWLYGEVHHLDTTILWAVATPVVLGLLLGDGISHAASAARQAADQTNGQLESRVQTAVSQALAARDAARTRQARGDIDAPSPPSPAV